MRKYFTVLILLISLTRTAQAAFPIVHQQHDTATITSGTQKALPHPNQVGPFTKVSAYSFLFVIAAFIFLAVFGKTLGISDPGSTWLTLTEVVSGISIIAATIGIIKGEGRFARIMLFMSVFLFLLILLFL